MRSRSTARAAERARLGLTLAFALAWLVPSLATAPAARAHARGERRVVIAFAGDVLFDRGVRAALDERGADALFAGVAPILRGADLAFANLECPLSRRGLRAAKPFSFRGDPENAAALARASFDGVTLANNHTLDYGRGAL